MKRRIFLLFTLPILLFSSEKETLQSANDLKLYERNEWKALLHYNNSLNIIDENFILNKTFSLAHELNASIKGFYTTKESYQDINSHPQCKFPGRLLFITHELNISKEEFPKIDCPDLKTYETKAPADNLFIVYASENVTNPSSMMGHTFLKYSGKNHQDRNVEHAITFYTIIENANLFTLAYQNIFSGMNGMFALQPYQDMIEQYTVEENRNVWEYQLNLSEYRRKLIYYHIWELKDIDMKYFFTNYNCSTVIYYNLSLANPKIYDDKNLWVTPLDTVKFLYKYNLIYNTRLSPSNEWLIKMTEEYLTSNDIASIKNIVKDKKYGDIPELDFFSLNLLERYCNLQYKHDNISGDEFKDFKNIISPLEKNNQTIFDISNYKSPNKIPNERQFTIGYSKRNQEEFAKISFLGASHLLSDDNREYFGETELKIGYLSFLLNQEKLQFDEFTLYGMKSYIPYEILTNDLSYQFETTVKKEYTKSMNYINTAKIDGGMGIDFLFKHDINLFAIANVGIGYNHEENTHLFFNPQIGGMIYEVFNMKSLFYYQPLFINQNKIYDKVTFNQNLFISKDYKFYINLEHIFLNEHRINYEFGFTKFF